MTEQTIPAEFGEKGAPEGTRRPYQKPAVAEEESFETCATLACSMASGQPGCGGRAGPISKSA